MSIGLFSLCSVLSRTLLLFGALLLAAQPLAWLANSWVDPLYNPAGLWVALAVAGLFVWSCSGPRLRTNPGAGRRALWLLALTALVRLAGQLLGVNLIGALALVLDVYALALLAGVGDRTRPLAPGWLALLFAFSLPLERVVQRSSGYLLQQLSAGGVCETLTLFGAEVSCHGLRIVWHGRDVLVDQPCSGASGLTLLLTLFALLAALRRPGPLAALAGVALTLAAAFVGNVVRIALLAAGIAHAESLQIDVLAAPWHELIGLFALTLAALPLLIWMRPVELRPVELRPVELRPAELRPGGRAQKTVRPAEVRPLVGVGFTALAALIVVLPGRPLDVAHGVTAIHLPPRIAGLNARPEALNAVEKRYFTRYGGAAARAHYGAFGLLVVSTSAPLRHLHAPDECLTGMGYRVRYLGSRYGRVPSALYRAVDGQGRAWRVAVTYLSDRGELATSVAEAVWRWLRRPGSTWTMVQRFGPAELPMEQLVAWDHAVARALDLPSLSDPLVLASQEL